MLQPWRHSAMSQPVPEAELVGAAATGNAMLMQRKIGPLSVS